MAEEAAQKLLADGWWKGRPRPDLWFESLPFVDVAADYVWTASHWSIRREDVEQELESFRLSYEVISTVGTAGQRI